MSKAGRHHQIYELKTHTQKAGSEEFGSHHSEITATHSSPPRSARKRARAVRDTLPASEGLAPAGFSLSVSQTAWLSLSLSLVLDVRIRVRHTWEARPPYIYSYSPFSLSASGGGFSGGFITCPPKPSRRLIFFFLISGGCCHFNSSSSSAMSFFGRGSRSVTIVFAQCSFLPVLSIERSLAALSVSLFACRMRGRRCD
jgi:hypothetical protein